MRHVRLNDWVFVSFLIGCGRAKSAKRVFVPKAWRGRADIGAVLIADAAEQFRLPLGSAIYFAVLTFTLAQASVGFIITINVMLRTPRGGEFKRYT
jgi:hypothetical protein